MRIETLLKSSKLLCWEAQPFPAIKGLNFACFFAALQEIDAHEQSFPGKGHGHRFPLKFVSKTQPSRLDRLG